MNLDEVKQYLIDGKKVSIIALGDKNNYFYIECISYNHNNNRGIAHVRDKLNKLHLVDIGDITEYVETKSTADGNLRKEIAFLLIQNNYAIDSNFKYTVDQVVEAIGESNEERK